MVLSKDIEATIQVLRGLGADIRLEGDTVTVQGASSGETGTAEADCGESGSTLRFLLPVAAALGRNARFTGSGRLPQRPLDTLLQIFVEKGLSCVPEGADNLPLRLSGKLPAGLYRLPGDVSSQYITGLLLALPLTGGESIIRLTTPLQSAGYVDMTLKTMAAFGVTVERLPDGYRIPAGSRYRSCDCAVEGDWSAAAFFLKAAAGLFARLGAKVRWEKGDLLISPGPLRGTRIDVSQIPDMAPALAACAAFAEGETLLTGCARLRIKESDRLTAIARGLTALGVPAEEGPDSLRIEGQGGPPHGGKIDGVNDHRIVMAFATAAAFASGQSEISDAEAVAKSYPAFFDDYTLLGGNVHVI